MIALTLAEIAAATGGTLHDAPDPDMQVTGRSASDSRHVGLAGMFVAIKGERVDGHDYAAQAIAAGAACVLASHPVGVPAIVVVMSPRPWADSRNTSSPAPVHMSLR